MYLFSFYFSFNIRIVVIIITILATALGSEPWSDAPSSIMGILLALGSNVCFALRNIGTKYYDDGESSQSKTTIEGFAAISLTGFIALIPVGFIFICYSYLQESQLEMIDANPYLLLSAT